jgi:hypothetical protein
VAVGLKKGTTQNIRCMTKNTKHARLATRLKTQKHNKVAVGLKTEHEIIERSLKKEEGSKH